MGTPQPASKVPGRSLFEPICRFLLRHYCPLRVYGAEHLPSSGFILCSNHASHMDSVVLAVASGRRFDDCAMVAAKDYFFDRRRAQSMAGWFITLIPVDRRASREGLTNYMAACRSFIEAGAPNPRTLIIFPEGTRTLTGKMKPFKKGPAMIAAELGLPLVPAYIDGSRESWPKGRLLPRPHRVLVTIGEPIYLDEFRGESRPKVKVYRQVTELLEQRVHLLSEVNHRGARP